MGRDDGGTTEERPTAQPEVGRLRPSRGAGGTKKGVPSPPRGSKWGFRFAGAEAGPGRRARRARLSKGAATRVTVQAYTDGPGLC